MDHYGTFLWPVISLSFDYGSVKYLHRFYDFQRLYRLISNIRSRFLLFSRVCLSVHDVISGNPCIPVFNRVLAQLSTPSEINTFRRISPSVYQLQITCNARRNARKWPEKSIETPSVVVKLHLIIGVKVQMTCNHYVEWYDDMLQAVT